MRKSDLAKRAANATFNDGAGISVTEALDDGFTLTDRANLVGISFMIVGYELAPGFREGQSFATVWCVKRDGEMVKFQDGGRDITGALASFAENGNHSNILLDDGLFQDSYAFEGNQVYKYSFEPFRVR